jgi:putative transposase
MSDWPHSPVHRLAEAGAYMVTCGTYLKEHHFRGRERLEFLHDSLLGLAEEYGWNLQAWAIFSNHYHFVAISPPDARTLVLFLKKLHSDTARAANRWDGTAGRQVWFQYRDTHLTFRNSYFARLSYVHRNAVHHRLVAEPSLYPWCSAGWFQREAPTAFYKTIMRFGTGRLTVPDDFAVEWSPERE